MLLVVKNLPVNAGNLRDMGSIPGSGRFPKGGHDNLLQHSCLKNSKDRWAWLAIIHEVTKSQTWLSKHVHTHTHTHTTTTHTISQFIPPHPFTLETISLFSASVTLFFFFLYEYVHVYHLKKNIPHIRDIIWYLFYSDLLHSVWQSLGPSMLLQMDLIHYF